GGIFAATGTGNSKEVRAYNGALGDVTGAPAGSSSARSSVSNNSYANDTFYREATVTWGLDAGNLAGGITAITFGLGSAGSSVAGLGAMQMSFDPPIAKTNQETLSLVLRHTWGRKTLSEQS